MKSTLATVVVPIGIPQRQGRLIGLVVGLIVFFTASGWLLLLLTRTNSDFGLRTIIPAATFSVLFMFAVVTGLMDLRLRTRWLAVLVILIAKCLNITAIELAASADFIQESPGFRDLLYDLAAMQLLVDVGTVLVIHTLLWPIRSLLGWQVHWTGERPVSRERFLTIWHLIGGVTFAVFLLVRPGLPTNQIPLLQLALQMFNLVIVVIVLLLATRRKHITVSIPIVLAGLAGLSLAELGFSYFAGSGNGVSLWVFGIWNCTVAGTVLFISFLLRWAGLEFHLPTSRTVAAVGRTSIEGMAANSTGRRKYQFSLRSLLLFTALLCIGPGGYIAWEQNQCRRGNANLIQIEKVLGKQAYNQPRPVWLQGVLGNNAFRQVRSIHAKSTNIVDADLASLSALPNLETALLDKTQVTGVGLASLSQLNDLRILGLSGTQVTDEGLVHLTPLTPLWHLMLDNTRVTDKGLVHLSGLTNLRTLRLVNANMTDDGLAHLAPLLNLKHLALDNTGVGNAGLTQFSAELRSLGLGNTKVKDAGLVHMTPLTKLEYLSLDGTMVTNAGLVHLSGLANLKTLRLQGTKVTDKGLAHLSPLRSLEYLFLDQSGVGDAGLAHLSADLKGLGLANTQVTDAGLVTISRLTKLETLDLSNNLITDTDLAHLEALPVLDTLVIKNTQVTKAGAAKLKRKWPALKIQR